MFFDDEWFCHGKDVVVVLFLFEGECRFDNLIVFVRRTQNLQILCIVAKSGLLVMAIPHFREREEIECPMYMRM